MKYSKNYFERYAKLSLSYCYDKRLLNLIKSEEPDWQSEELNVGLEVVRAISTKEGKQQFIVNEYFGKGLRGELIQKDVSVRFSEYKKMIKVHEGIAYITKDHYGCDEKYKEIENAIIKKTSLLNNNYKIFGNNWLYIFSETALLEDFDIQLIVNRFSEKIEKEKLKYNKIFINAINKIFIIHNINDSSIITVPEEMLKCLKKEALEN